MSAHWNVLPRKKEDLIDQLLFNRGIITEEDQEKFFNPKLSEYEKDFHIPGIEKAKKRILKAIKKDELIIAYGDYDVDGICGAAVLYLGLSQIGARILPYIPHRNKEGYGLSSIGLQYAKDLGADLIITVDCGIVNLNEAKQVQDLGMELIITDHHQPLDEKPDCYAIVHSIKICGTAVAWSLVRQLVPNEKATELLDLVAIATVSDVMPLVDVNRSLVKEGLERINDTERVGLKALFNEAGIKRGEIGAYEIGHIIAPRLNAMGRLEHAMDSLRLLCTRDITKAVKLASLVAETNNHRKILTDEAIEIARSEVIKQNKKIYVLAHETWLSGIIGLIAGRLADETKKPTIVISIGEIESKGSARSANGINIVELIRKCSDILVAVGGHTAAAGFTIKTQHIEEFRERLELLIENELISDNGSRIEVEAEVSSKELNLHLIKELARFEPFGNANPYPVLATENMTISGLKTVGEGKHLKGKVDGIDFIAFNQGSLLSVVKDGMQVAVAYTVEINRFNGNERIQLKVKNIAVL